MTAKEISMMCDQNKSAILTIMLLSIFMEHASLGIVNSGTAINLDLDSIIYFSYFILVLQQPSLPVLIQLSKRWWGVGPHDCRWRTFWVGLMLRRDWGNSAKGRGTAA